MTRLCRNSFGIGPALWGLIFVPIFLECPRVNSYTLACVAPYSCMGPADCQARHKDYGGLPDQILHKCDVQGRRLCCPARNPAAVYRPAATSPAPATLVMTPPEDDRSTVTERPEPLRHRNAGLFNTDRCGYSLDFRITGGVNATYGEHAWMALIGFTGRNGVKENVCGGTLINERYVLTAAHCLVTSNPNSPLMHVTLGEFDLKRERDCGSDEFCPPAFDLRVEKIIPHQNYNQRTFKNDIALLRLSENAYPHPNRSVVPICLPFNMSQFNITNNYKYETTGWGLISNNNNGVDETVDLPDILQKVNLYQSECNICKNKPVFCPIADSQLCALGFRDKDVCKGDSGGPLTSPVDGVNRVYQFGVTSFKSINKCGQETVPSVFTKVSSYMNWILDNVRPS